MDSSSGLVGRLDRVRLGGEEDAEGKEEVEKKEAKEVKDANGEKEEENEKTQVSFHRIIIP